MSTKSEITTNAANACIVCYKNAEYYSIGMCEHPVCYECSTRMRVLCQQNECPICRQDLPKVVFTKEIKPFRFLKKGNLLDTRYNIYFDSQEVQEKFTQLLCHKCTVCPGTEVFSSFNALKEHMRRKHDLHYCELCSENLKIFSHERRSYTKQELSRHRRKGDLDDKSHKGHPLCEFCDRRYMDNDELYRHLRRDHLFCHFCDADGLHHYYSSYEYLREHFRQEHHLCEEGSCADEQFTSVFRTDIDLKAHKTSVHGKQLGKHAAKQARTLELEFTLAPRDLRNRRGPPGASSRTYDGNTNHPRNHQPEPEPVEEPVFVRQPLVDVASTEQFPTLGNSAPCLVPSMGQTRGRGNLTIRGTLRSGNYDQNFPALGPEAPAASAPSNNAAPIAKTLNFSVSSSSNKVGPAGRQPAAAPNLSIHVNHRPNGTVTTRLSGPNLRIKPGPSRETDFPALGKCNADVAAAAAAPPSSANASSWTKVTCVKPGTVAAMRGKKVAPPPLAPSPPPIRSGEDFPTLGKPTTTPTATSWVQAQSTDTNTSSTMDATKGKAKKKKMKQQSSATNNSNGSSSGNSNNINSGNSNGNISSNESSSSVKDKKSNSKTEPTKKDKSKNKQNLEQNGTATVSSTTVTNVSTTAATPRKRSEIKIDNLNTTNNNNNNNLSFETKTANSLMNRAEEFPALGRGGARPPPGLSSPPPGFGAPKVASVPPPGFLSRPNGLTFTNSSGESYAIVPDADAETGSYTYLPPANFQRRNQNLIAEFNNCFGHDESEELKAFRFLSGLFRSGACDAQSYYKQCKTVMGAESFKRLFPELLALLPDIDKQRELFEIHRRETGSGVKGLDSCANCGQILRSADLQSHASSHTLENHFPALGRTATASTGAWSKK